MIATDDSISVHISQENLPFSFYLDRPVEQISKRHATWTPSPLPLSRLVGPSTFPANSSFGHEHFPAQHKIKLA